MDPKDSVGGDYEVFLSFRGVDTRQGFTDILHEYMTMADIRVFRDDDELEIGDRIDSILEAIDSSRICIPIFSPKFAESKWCLREVSRMVELKKMIVPVFYKVSPDDVKLKETSLYSDDLRKLEEKHGDQEETDKWKSALREAALNKGRELGDKSYTKFCKELVEEVLSKLGPRQRLEIDYFVGDDNKEAAMKLLDIRPASYQEVVYIGIYGMGGIGKTTIAKLLYNEFSSSFDHCGFVPDIREFSRSKGVNVLPGYLFDNLQPKSVTPFSRSEQIPSIFKNKKVFLILDDVDSYEQIKEIAREPGWFGSGSRIILTTRDKKVLQDYTQESRSEIRHLEMKELKSGWALELFSKCAFGTHSPPSPYEKLSKRAVAYAGGLPLAITVIGKYLRSKREEEVWEEFIERLEKNPPKEVKDKLLISYEVLEDEQKKIFLDIACLYIDQLYTEASDVFYLWKACNLYPRLTLEVLQSRSLVKVNGSRTLQMHDQLRDLGRDIVRTKSKGDITKQSRLWEDSEVVEVLKSKKNQKNKIEALQACKSDTNFIYEEFVSFDNLIYLELRGSSKLQGDFSGLLPQLRWLSCGGILESRNLVPSNLVILDLSFSNFDENWDGFSQIQVLKKLKVLNLSGCKRLARTPVFVENMALERLILDRCIILDYIDPSIGELHHLNYLCFQDCTSLCELPESIGELHSLRELKLGKTGITSLPDSIGRLEKLEHLRLDWCESLVSIPQSLGYLHSLRELDLEEAGITSLPDSVQGLKKLECLNLSSCHSLVSLPQSLGNLPLLIVLTIKDTKITRLPSSIGGLEKLVSLNLSYSKIRLLPDSFGELRSLAEFDLSRSHVAALPDSIGRLENLKRLDLSNCKEIRALPDSLGELKSLQVLDLSYTGITELPEPIERLEKLKVLRLSGSKIRQLPFTLNHLSLLQVLELNECDQLQELPELPTSLTDLYIEADALNKVPDLSNLQGLASLVLRTCGGSALDWSFSLPSNCKLQSLTIDFLLISRLPDLSNCFELNVLVLKCQHSLQVLPNLSSLRKLLILQMESCQELIEIPGIGNLQCLTSLHINDCSSLVSLENLRELQALREFELFRCEKLTEIPGLGELRGLNELRVEDCDSLERLDNLAKLEELEKLTFIGCRQLTEIRGIGELQSLISLYIKSCPSLISLENLGELKKFVKFELILEESNKLGELPELPESLTMLHVKSRALFKVPNLLKMSNLRDLKLIDGSFWGEKKEIIEPSNLQGIANLTRLEKLELFISDLRALPRELSALSELSSFVMGCPSFKCTPMFPSSLRLLVLESYNSKLKLPNLSHLRNLESLVIGGFTFTGLSGLQLPESLKWLNLFNCQTRSSDMIPPLKNLIHLELVRCKELAEISNLRGLDSLETLHIDSCESLERIGNLFELRKLVKVTICCCPKLNVTPYKFTTSSFSKWLGEEIVHDGKDIWELIKQEDLRVSEYLAWWEGSRNNEMDSEQEKQDCIGVVASADGGRKSLFRRLLSLRFSTR